MYLVINGDDDSNWSHRFVYCQVSDAFKILCNYSTSKEVCYPLGTLRGEVAELSHLKF